MKIKEIDSFTNFAVKFDVLLTCMFDLCSTPVDDSFDDDQCIEQYQSLCAQIKSYAHSIIDVENKIENLFLGDVRFPWTNFRFVPYSDVFSAEVSVKNVALSVFCRYTDLYTYTVFSHLIDTDQYEKEFEHIVATKLTNAYERVQTHLLQLIVEIGLSWVEIVSEKPHLLHTVDVGSCVSLLRELVAVCETTSKTDQADLFFTLFDQYLLTHTFGARYLNVSHLENALAYAKASCVV